MQRRTPVDEQGLLTTATLYAALYHRGQVDKLGEPYLLHLMAVATAPAMTLKQRTCAMLHDILEDTDITVEQLRQSFPSDYVDTIVALTHLKTETRDEYYARVKADADARVIKMVDVMHNQSRLRHIEDDKTRQRLFAKYDHALEVLRGL